MTRRVEIKTLPTGVPGLDAVLGGGFPEYSFNMIAGVPGSGKTTLAHHIMFGTASPDRPALYVTVLGEPPLKMLRYQQQFAFFDAAKIPHVVEFLHLGGEVLDGGLEKVLEAIVRQIERTHPKLVLVDSFRAVVRHASQPGQMDLQHFVQRLALYLTRCEATTFLIGEYAESEATGNPVFTVADGALWLSQEVKGSAIVRKLQVIKMRGQSELAGLHTMKISAAGLRVYPRLPEMSGFAEPPAQRGRCSTGVTALDALLDGGIPTGHSVMIVGPSGAGKTTLAHQFIRDGLARGEAAVIAMFGKRHEQSPRRPVRAGETRSASEGKLTRLRLRPLDLSVDETMEELAEAVRLTGATRVVIDSMSGLELAVAPAFREDFRESLYRMIGALTGLGVTVVMTAELVDSYSELRLSPHGVSFLADGLILQRHVELHGRLERVMVVVKMRECRHSNELVRYHIEEHGLVIDGPFTGYEGLLGGMPRRTLSGE